MSARDFAPDLAFHGREYAVNHYTVAGDTVRVCIVRFFCDHLHRDSIVICRADFVFFIEFEIEFSLKR